MSKDRVDVIQVCSEIGKLHAFYNVEKGKECGVVSEYFQWGEPQKLNQPILGKEWIVFQKNGTGRNRHAEKMLKKMVVWGGVLLF